MTEHSIIERTLRVASRATAVTFFEDRAEIRRHAQVELAAGTHRLELEGLSPFSDDRSLQVKALGEGAASLMLSGARVVRRLISAEDYARSELAELEQNLRRAREARGVVLRQSARIRQRRTHMKKLFEQFCRSLSRVPSRAAEDELAGWRTSWAELLSAESISRSQLHSARCEELKLELELARAEARLRERRGEEPRCETWAEVQLDAKAAGVYDFELSYRSPCALWRPEHWAQLLVDEGDAGQGRIELVTYATAWQATGERWEDVAVSFSTARPSRASSPPLLADDVLRSRKKAPEERRRIVVESRDETLSTTGAAGARSVDEMPGVDDGGEPLQYRGAAPLSLPSNGQPFRVEIARRQLDAKVLRLLRGEASELAHMLANTQLDGSGPLLAGPVRILRGDSLLGRAKLDFVAPGEAFEMGFGPDDAIRLRRRVQTKRHESLTGQQRIEFEVLLYLSNLSNEERALQLVERIPVSELDGLHVELKESEGFGALDEDGFIIAECKLAGNGQQKLKLSFNVEAPAKMVLPF